MAGFHLDPGSAAQRGDKADPTTGRKRLGRRRFLAYLVAAPTLTVAGRIALGPEADAVVPSLPQPSDAADFTDVWMALIEPTTGLMVLEVTEDNRIRFEVPRAEVGQGITTALAMLVAEELDTRLSDVDVPLSKSRMELFANQSTGASAGVRTLWDPVREMAAAARARLVTAAAERWNLPADRLVTKETAVWAPDGRSATYGSLSAAASKVVTPAVSADPKKASNYTLIGKPTGRVDARDLVTGKAKYALDLDVPGALPTVVARPPTINGTVVSYDDTTAKAMPGVVAVTEIRTGIAVSAESMYQALEAKDALTITWGKGPIDHLSDADIKAKLAAAVPRLPTLPVLTRSVDAAFDFAFVSHAPLEVHSVVAEYRPATVSLAAEVEVWMSTESPVQCQGQIAREMLILPERVKVNVVRGGGSFGAGLFYDQALEAVRISKGSIAR